jgi:hypothetical protein
MILSMHLPRGTVENHEKPRSDSRCPGWKSSWAPHKYKSTALPLDQRVRFPAADRGLNFFLKADVMCIHSTDTVITFVTILVQNAIMDVQTVMYVLFSLFLETAPWTNFMEVKPNTDSLTDRMMACHLTDHHSPVVKNCRTGLMQRSLLLVMCRMPQSICMGETCSLVSEHFSPHTQFAISEHCHHTVWIVSDEF